MLRLLTTAPCHSSWRGQLGNLGRCHMLPSSIFIYEIQGDTFVNSTTQMLFWNLSWFRILMCNNNKLSYCQSLCIWEIICQVQLKAKGRQSVLSCATWETLSQLEPLEKNMAWLWHRGLSQSWEEVLQGEKLSLFYMYCTAWMIT